MRTQSPVLSPSSFRLPAITYQSPSIEPHEPSLYALGTAGTPFVHSYSPSSSV